METAARCVGCCATSTLSSAFAAFGDSLRNCGGAAPGVVVFPQVPRRFLEDSLTDERQARNKCLSRRPQARRGSVSGKSFDGPAASQTDQKKPQSSPGTKNAQGGLTPKSRVVSSPSPRVVALEAGSGAPFQPDRGSCSRADLPPAVARLAAWRVKRATTISSECAKGTRKHARTLEIEGGDCLLFRNTLIKGRLRTDTKIRIRKLTTARRSSPIL